MLAKTPMMKQYQQLKSNYPDTLLFFRLGDFYEMFGTDAEIASRELEITLTGRDAGLANRVPMCGVPFHAAENYLARLIQKGYKVAICEQVEDPRQAKGIVRREVIRVITPGTTLESQLLSGNSSNYLAAVVFFKRVWGLAFCDVSTGEFWVAEFSGNNALHSLKDELKRLNPSEILLTEDLKEKLPSFFDSFVNSFLNSTVFYYEKCRDLLKEHFTLSSLEPLGLAHMQAAVCSAGAILYYLQETQKAAPQQIRTIQHYQPSSFMLLDATTSRNLEITRTLWQNEKKGSLLDIMDKTKTAPGSRLLRHWLERPLTDKRVLEERLDAVESLTENWSLRQALRKDLEQVYDLERLTTRVLYLRSTPRELLSLKTSLAVLPQIKRLLTELKKTRYILKLSGELDTLEDIHRLLEESLKDDAPLNLHNGGVIKTGYHPEVDALREASLNGKEWIAQLESKEKENTGIKSLKVGFNKVFGYYFEVTKANLSLVPAHFQRKQTLANGERYVTEELLKLESQVLGAEEKLVALEAEIYQGLLEKIGSAAARIQNTSHILAQLDVLQSMAELAVKNGYTRPRLLEKGEKQLVFRGLRHPVVEQLCKDTQFVPNDLSMTPATKLCIITGPNMGGKSTFCRSVALAVIMAQAGSFVPAAEAEIALCDRIFARVGASDDLGGGQSTFMVEMNEVANILHNATADSLVILDEVGRGTSTYDGLSMAWAVSEYLLNTTQVKTLFATHYHELTQLAENYPGVKNLSVAVQEKGEEIIFLHRIVNGPADKSYGIQVGRLAGLPPAVIRRAQSILKTLQREHLDSNDNLMEKADSSDASPHIVLNGAEEECLRLIANLDIMELTPLDALNKIYQLQQLLKNGA